jgi:hypothetical protein
LNPGEAKCQSKGHPTQSLLRADWRGRPGDQCRSLVSPRHCPVRFGQLNLDPTGQSRDATAHGLPPLRSAHYWGARRVVPCHGRCCLTPTPPAATGMFTSVTITPGESVSSAARSWRAEYSLTVQSAATSTPCVHLLFIRTRAGRWSISQHPSGCITAWRHGPSGPCRETCKPDPESPLGPTPTSITGLAKTAI